MFKIVRSGVNYEYDGEEGGEVDGNGLDEDGVVGGGGGRMEGLGLGEGRGHEQLRTRDLKGQSNEIFDPLFFTSFKLA